MPRIARLFQLLSQCAGRLVVGPRLRSDSFTDRTIGFLRLSELTNPAADPIVRTGPLDGLGLLI